MAKSILVVGISVLDFIFKVPQMPDRPVKFRADDVSVTGGGCAASAAVAIARLGGNPSLATLLGDDLIGNLIRDQLQAEGVDCDLSPLRPDFRSSVSSVYVDDAGERQIVNYRERGMREADVFDQLNDPGRFAVVLADTTWPQGAAAAMRLAKKWQVPGVLDAEDAADIHLPSIKLASHIGFSANGLAAFQSGDIEVGLRAAHELSGAWAAVTRGELGAFWFNGNAIAQLQPPKVKAVDTLGAGDVWHGAFALRLAETGSEEAAVAFANTVAAIKCTRFGGRTGTPTRDEVDGFIAENG